MAIEDHPAGPTKNDRARLVRALTFLGVVGLDENCCSTKRDPRSILVAGAQRRRPEGVNAREASALETIWLVLPNMKSSPIGRGFFVWIGLTPMIRAGEPVRQTRPKDRLARRGEAKAPEEHLCRMQRRKWAIRLVLPNL